MSPPLASIVIPAWNRAASIERAVRSALGQTLDDLEVVVVDNASSDGTGAVVEAIGDPRVVLVRQDTNLGPAGGRNAGAAVASGRLLGFLDSDDELEERWLELLAPALLDGHPAGSCGFRLIPGDGSPPGIALPTDAGPAFFGMRLMKGGPAGTLVLERTVFERIGGYTASLRYAENTELALRVAKHCADRGSEVAAVAEPLVRWYRSPERSYDPRVRLQAAELTIASHAEQLARDPGLLAAHYATAGHLRMEIGDRVASRRWCWSALRTQPSVRRLARFLEVATPVTASIGQQWRRRSRANAGAAAEP